LITSEKGSKVDFIHYFSIIKSKVTGRESVNQLVIATSQ